MQASSTPLLSPIATSVLKTCSGGNPIACATLGALKSSTSTSYSRASYATLWLSRMRAALVFFMATSVTPGSAGCDTSHLSPPPKHTLLPPETPRSAYQLPIAPCGWGMVGRHILPPTLGGLEDSMRA